MKKIKGDDDIEQNQLQATEIYVEYTLNDNWIDITRKETGRMSKEEQ